jgi:Ser/Thr protein kinase RdoA (MazF antagonist)
MDDAVATIVRRELGAPPERVRRVDEGLLHETYELRCRGSGYVLQFAADGTDDRDDDLRRGLYWYEALTDIEIPVPAVVTERVGEYEGRAYGIVERLPGATATLAVTPERTRAAGRHLARIHDAVGFETAGQIRVTDGDASVEPFQVEDPTERLRRSLEKRAAILRESGMTAAATAVTGSFGGETPLSEAFDPVLCHGDFSPDNVLYEGAAVTGILDFDRATAGHAHRDLAAAATAFWMHDPSADWGIREALYDGYRDVRALDPSFDRVEPLYGVESLARLVAGMAELGELSADERSFYDGAIVEAAARADRD